MRKEHYILVEWFDQVTGEWRDLGEAKTLNAALSRIGGLSLADATPQQYRIVETTVRYAN